MKRFFKSFLICLLALVMCLGCVACFGKDDKGKDAGKTKGKDPIQTEDEDPVNVYTVDRSNLIFDENFDSQQSVIITSYFDDDDPGYIKFEVEDPSIASCEWGYGWVRNQIALFITAKSIGTTKVYVYHQSKADETRAESSCVLVLNVDVRWVE